MDALELLLNPERAARVPGPHIPPEADTWALCGITSLLQRFHANTLPLRQHETGPYRLPPQMTCATMVLATIDLHWIADICRRADRSSILLSPGTAVCHGELPGVAGSHSMTSVVLGGSWATKSLWALSDSVAARRVGKTCCRAGRQTLGFWRIFMSKCRYCNSTSYGSCSSSPNKKHEHLDDEKHCEFCGSSSYGSCSSSPTKKHHHGSGANKCRWCGSTSTGSCSSSPYGKHEK